MLQYFIFFIIVCLLKLSDQSTETGEGLDYTESTWPQICQIGKQNSPIDFPARMSTRYINSTERFKILSNNYAVTSGKAWSVLHGYKFYVNMTSVGSLSVMKNNISYKYDLVDMHLHVFSEHTFQGIPTEMEIHLVHSKDTAWLASQGVTNDTDSAFKYLVIGILFKTSGETNNTLISQFDFKNLGPMTNLNMSPFAQPSNNFFHYEGGLTTPSCDEAVNWVVLENIQTMSNAQYEEVKKWVEEIYSDGNARAVRPIYNRSIYYVQNSPVQRDDKYSGEIIAVIILSIVLGLLIIANFVYFVFYNKKSNDVIPPKYEKSPQLEMSGFGGLKNVDPQKGREKPAFAGIVKK